MESIGRTLHETRERLGLTLEEVERGTRIRTHNLEAMERGEFDALPSPVQARGFLHNYSEFLGLDADQILLQFAERLQSNRKRQNARVTYNELPTRPSVQVRSRRPRWLSTDLFIAAGITIAILALLIWGGSRMMTSLGESETVSNEISELLLPSVTVSPFPSNQEAETREPSQSTPIPTETELIPTQSFIVGPTNQVGIQLLIEQRSWVSVIVDGEEQFPEHRATPGQVLEFQGENAVEVLTGNGAGVRVFFNGQDQGLMGDLGQVVVRLWTLGGVVTPTPTQSNTPTITFTPSITPTTEPSPTSQSNSEGG
jgi:cytoskeletal protein RodZ